MLQTLFSERLLGKTFLCVWWFLGRDSSKGCQAISLNSFDNCTSEKHFLLSGVSRQFSLWRSHGAGSFPVLTCQAFCSFSILQISVTAQKRACNTATCVTHRLAGLLSRSGGVVKDNFVPTNVGSDAFGRRRRDLQAWAVNGSRKKVTALYYRLGEGECWRLRSTFSNLPFFRDPTILFPEVMSSL
jgi:hypothetical protein